MVILCCVVNLPRCVCFFKVMCVLCICVNGCCNTLISLWGSMKFSAYTTSFTESPGRQRGPDSSPPLRSAPCQQARAGGLPTPPEGGGGHCQTSNYTMNVECGCANREGTSTLSPAPRYDEATKLLERDGGRQRGRGRETQRETESGREGIHM